MTIALAASFALVVVITLVKLLGRPGSADASGEPPKSQNTPWLTFVPATDPKTPSSHSPEVPQDLRPAPNKPAFLPSLIRPEWEPRVVFDPLPRIKNDPSRQVLPVNQFATTPVIAAPVAVDNRVYVAARDGMLSVINTDTMKVVEQKKYNLMIKGLLLRDSKLMADVQNMSRRALVDFGRVVQTLDPEDAEPAEKQVPYEGARAKLWFFNVNEQVVAYKGKYYCPRTEEIRVLSGHEERGFHSHVSDLERWRIALLPNGPMGYDNSSVYELDANLCPIRRLIDVNTDTDDPRTYFPASAIASDGKTLCFVSVQKQSARMQIWSLDAKEKIRECTVLADQHRILQGQYFRAAGKRLFAVGDGYLYCGRELIWMNAATGEVRRYVPNAAGSNQQQNLTPPLVVNQKLFVGFEGGGVFVFDLGAFSAQGERRAEP